MDQMTGRVGGIDVELDWSLLLGRGQSGEGQGECRNAESEQLPPKRQV
jgi:hypothetical protein